MTIMITNISKYVIILLITIYTYYAFRSFGYEKEKKQGMARSGKRTYAKKKRIFSKMRTIIFLIHFISYFVLYLNTENLKIIGLYLCEFVMLLLVFVLYQWVYQNISKLLLNNMILFIVSGLIILTRLSFDKAVKQFLIIIASFIVCIIIPLFIEKLKIITKLGWAYGILGIGALLSVFVFGHEQYGAKNWISIFDISIQPSEFVKILFVFAIAGLLSYRTDFIHVVKVTALAAIHVLILVLEKDLGGALIFFVAYLIMLYVATGQPLYFFSGLIAGSGASFIAYHLFSHVRVRVMAWQNPWTVIEQEGYQVSQSLFAIGTGGWFGMGLTKGLPTSIPVVDSDFIFSGISEEMGGIYGVCLILIYISTFVMSYNISMKIQGDFYKLVALGFSSMLGFQAFLSIGGVTKFIPSTGVTLPFISYGGSSILSTVIMFAIIQGIFIMNQDRIGKSEKESKQQKNQ